ncbi:dipeptide/oligopeptide/nickel ABC transporter ATP-binding protein [Clostridium zeae]|uniref:Dipeptide/oligopeptide/nickel ABC transporter ATP-binding protein n=1 Tax=Clostridium zeae TaxID=2759022 RepID=A0ABQ1EG32_9CLOT|nr:ABC transporter ATP-binding protein [Clostridium zeae]GFZ33787.1 dipeptide/oligopeptide/nickel ABC transporter ATP-binding protein [Clostridium zeae]
MVKELLKVNELKICFHTSYGIVNAVDDVSFSIYEGRVLGIVGESGCGKSVTAMSILRLQDKSSGAVESGEIVFEDQNLLEFSEQKLKIIRGNKIAMIFQEPMTSLNPVFTIGAQIGESLKIHQKLKGIENKAKCIEMLELVGIPRADKVVNEYPHQLSGGMRQRVMIAIALCCNPKLLIADEPTTALDVTIQAQVIELMKEIRRKLQTSIMLITHDLGVIAEMADDVVVMYSGKIVEQCGVVDIFDNPKHPYTKGLLESRTENVEKGEILNCISGMVPSPVNIPKGCSFNPRCSSCMEVCRREKPPLIEIEQGHKVRCWLYGKKEEI